MGQVQYASDQERKNCAESTLEHAQTSQECSADKARRGEPFAPDDDADCSLASIEQCRSVCNQDRLPSSATAVSSSAPSLPSPSLILYTSH